MKSRSIYRWQTKRGQHFDSKSLSHQRYLSAKSSPPAKEEINFKKLGLIQFSGGYFGRKKNQKIELFELYYHTVNWTELTLTLKQTLTLCPTQTLALSPILTETKIRQKYQFLGVLLSMSTMIVFWFTAISSNITVYYTHNLEPNLKPNSEPNPKFDRVIETRQKTIDF